MTTRHELDARGHHCPVPTLRLGKVLAQMAPGAQVRLTADDPMARIDVPHFCNEAGHELLSVETEGATSVFIVRKRA